MNKKLITKTILILFMCASVFAKSNKKAEPEVNSTDIESIDLVTDVDEVNEVDEIITIDESEVTAPVASSKDSYYDDEDYNDDYDMPATPAKPAKKKKTNFFKDVFTFGNKGKYIYPDETSVFSKPVIGGLKQFAATITVNPETADAGFGTKFQGLYYIVFMDAKSRETLKKAADQYLDDFANKKLNRTNKKSYKIYGKTGIKLRWGSIKTSTPNRAEGNAHLGYEFIEKSPYFVITVPELQNKHYEDTTTVPMGSNKLEFYFTKAQLAALTDMLSEQKISSAILSYELEEYGETAEVDSY